MEEGRYSIKALDSLTLAEKVDLLNFYNHDSTYKVICKLQDAMVELARNEAMQIAPHEREKRLAAMDVAYAMDRGFRDFRLALKHVVDEHIAETKAVAMEKAIKDRDFIEKIIINQ